MLYDPGNGKYQDAHSKIEYKSVREAANARKEELRQFENYALIIPLWKSNMAKKRKKCQNPTKLITCPYVKKKSKGQEAVELYNSTGRTVQRWQTMLAQYILAVNKKGLWVHTKFGYSVLRRNGKNEVVAIREMYGLTIGEHILHTYVR